MSLLAGRGQNSSTFRMQRLMRFLQMDSDSPCAGNRRTKRLKPDSAPFTNRRPSSMPFSAYSIPLNWPSKVGCPGRSPDFACSGAVVPAGPSQLPPVPAGYGPACRDRARAIVPALGARASTDTIFFGRSSTDRLALPCHPGRSLPPSRPQPLKAERDSASPLPWPAFRCRLRLPPTSDCPPAARMRTPCFTVAEGRVPGLQPRREPVAERFGAWR